MKELEFISLIFLYWPAYMGCLLISFVLFFPILKVFRFQVLDPYFMHFVLTVFANSIPLFLLSLNLISSNDFVYFIIAECLFWIGFIINIKKEFRINNAFIIRHEDAIYKSLFYIFLIMFFLLESFTYINFGIL